MNIVQENIAQYGWHLISVMEDEEGPSFSYSIGLYETFGHPEVILIGLTIDLAQSLINNIGHTIKEGGSYAEEKFYSDILDNYDCKMLKVHEAHYAEYVGRAMDHYNAPFPLIQCVYPTVQGAFPWDEEWPKDLDFTQPVLNKN